MKLYNLITYVMLLFILIPYAYAFTTSEYRELIKNSDDLVYADNNNSNIVEFLAKSSDYDFIRYRFENNLEKIYFGSSLASTSQYRLYNGTKQIIYKNVYPFVYNYNGNILITTDYFTDSYKKNYVGTLKKTINLESEKAKTKIEFVPKDNSTKLLNFTQT